MKTTKVLECVEPKDVVDGVFVVPDDIDEIGYRAFSHLHELKRVVIPATVKRINNEAFCVCNKLESAEFRGADFKVNGPPIFCQLFHSCSKLKEIVYPNSAEGNKKFETIWGNIRFMQSPNCVLKPKPTKTEDRTK